MPKNCHGLGTMSPFGNMRLVVIPGILDSEGYVSTLDIDIPQLMAEHSDKNLVFMQDNAAVHTSRRSMECLRKKFKNGVCPLNQVNSLVKISRRTVLT